MGTTNTSGLDGSALIMLPNFSSTGTALPLYTLSLSQKTMDGPTCRSRAIQP